MGKEKLTRKERWSVSEWDLGERENGGLKEKGNAPLKERLAAALGNVEKKILEKEKVSCIEERNENFDVVAPIFSKWWSLARG